MPKEKKIFEDFARDFKTMDPETRLKFIKMLPRGKVLDMYAAEASLEQLRELKADFLVRCPDDWYDLMNRLKKRHSPHYTLLKT